VFTANSFEGFEEKLDDASTNLKMENTDKPPSIFVARINNFSLLSQLLKEIAADEYAIKNINEQTKIQPKISIACVNIVKELKARMQNSTYTNRSKREALK
jgi:hypothetical protein